MNELEFEFFVKVNRVIGIDTNILIALIESHPHYRNQVKKLFEYFTENNTRLAFSNITIPEVLIKPLKKQKEKLVNEYKEQFLADSIILAGVDSITAFQAAEIGARFNLNSMDSLIIASISNAGATGFITADQDFRRVDLIDVLILQPEKKSNKNGTK